MGQIDFYNYIILACIGIGLIRFQRMKLLPRTLPFFLLITLFVECATPLSLIHFSGSNHWFFNLFTTLEFVYYSFLFYCYLRSKKQKRVVLVMLMLFLTFTVVNVLFIQGMHRFHTISYRVGAVMIVVWCFLYFRQLMRSEGYLVLVKDPFFWISTGLLFFYMGFFFYFSAFDYIVYKKIAYEAQLWSIISNTLNILLYTSFGIALLCPKKKAISSGL